MVVPAGVADVALVVDVVRHPLLGLLPSGHLPRVHQIPLVTAVLPVREETTHGLVLALVPDALRLLGRGVALACLVSGHDYSPSWFIATLLAAAVMPAVMAVMAASV